LIKKTQPGFKAKPPSNHSHFWPKKWFLMSFLATKKVVFDVFFGDKYKNAMIETSNQTTNQLRAATSRICSITF